MLVSYRHQFLFIHVPKAGGTSIRKCLAPYAESPQLLWENRLLERLGIRVNHIGPYRRKRFRGHSSARTIKRYLPKTVYAELFKFAFVRNPWDMLVSLYHFIPSRPNHRYRDLVANMEFPEFVDHWTRHSECQQSRMVLDSNDRPIVDFVGRMERIEEDFDQIRSRLGIESKLKHSNRSSHRDYRTYYTAATERLVAQRLAKDIELFGYTFEGKRLAA